MKSATVQWLTTSDSAEKDGQPVRYYTNSAIHSSKGESSVVSRQ